jgi:hypothetical protein
VFSHPSEVDLVTTAAEAGYDVGLHVVMIPLELSGQRVAHRVAAGGHDVPADKLAARYQRLWDHVATAVPRCHRAVFYDNADDDGPDEVPAYRYGVADYPPRWPAWTPEAIRSFVSSRAVLRRQRAGSGHVGRAAAAGVEAVNGRPPMPSGISVAAAHRHLLATSPLAPFCALLEAGPSGHPGPGRDRPVRHRGVAVRGFLLAGNTEADCLLFVDRQAVGALEAKKRARPSPAWSLRRPRTRPASPTMSPRAGEAAAVPVRVDRHRDPLHQRVRP